MKEGGPVGVLLTRGAAATIGLFSAFVAFKGRIGVDSALDEIVVLDVPGRPSPDNAADWIGLVGVEVPFVFA